MSKHHDELVFSEAQRIVSDEMRRIRHPNTWKWRRRIGFLAAIAAVGAATFGALKLDGYIQDETPAQRLESATRTALLQPTALIQLGMCSEELRTNATFYKELEKSDLRNQPYNAIQASIFSKSADLAELVQASCEMPPSAIVTIDGTELSERDFHLQASYADVIADNTCGAVLRYKAEAEATAGNSADAGVYQARAKIADEKSIPCQQ